MGKNITLDDVMNSSFGESSSEIRASFRKTIQTRQYESEVVEYESTVKIDKPLTGAERILLSAILHIQLEYTAYCDLVHKRQVTVEEFNSRKAALTEEINSLKSKAESTVGKSLDEYFELAMSGE